MKLSSLFRASAMAVFVAAGSLLSAQPYHYTVMLDPFADATMTETLMARYAEQGLVSVDTLERPGMPMPAIVFGYYEYAPDAQMVVNDLRSRRIGNAQLLQLPTPIEEPKPAVSYPDPKRPKILEENSRMPSEAEAATADVSRVTFIMDSNLTGDEKIERLLDLEVQLSDVDPVKGELSLRLGYLYFFEKGDRASSRRYFERVATHGVAAPKATRLDAAYRVARLNHGENRRLDSYYVYHRVLEEGITGRTRSEILAQLTGLHVEFSRDERIATLEDSRRYMIEALQQIDPTHIDQVILIRLMACQSYYWEKEYELAAEVFEEFVRDFDGSDQRKEVAMARNFLAFSYRALGKKPEAYRVLEDTLKMDLREDDTWAIIADHKIAALRWLIHYANEDNDVSRREGYEEQLKNYEAEKTRRAMLGG